jgi:hypothetical protein
MALPLSSMAPVSAGLCIPKAVKALAVEEPEPESLTAKLGWTMSLEAILSVAE